LLIVGWLQASVFGVRPRSVFAGEHEGFSNKKAVIQISTTWAL
jgi:hypothetical protein